MIVRVAHSRGANFEMVENAGSVPPIACSGRAHHACAGQTLRDAIMIRIGIIGLGWWGKQIVACLKESRRFKVVAGCDIDHNTIAPFAAAQGFDLVVDYRDLLKRPDIDAIAVVTPHLLHEEMALAVLASGKQLFCEKPLGLTKSSAERILEANAGSGGVLGI